MGKVIIYIFEGADVVGKTYLANQVSKTCNIPLVKKPFRLLDLDKDGLKTDRVELYSHFFWESLFPVGSHYPIIYDRSLLSSLVFSKIFNRKYNLDYIYDYLIGQSKKIKIFLVTADEATISERLLNGREEKFFSIQEILKIQTLYIEFAQTLSKKGTNIIWIDNSKENEKNAITKCLSEI